MKVYYFRQVYWWVCYLLAGLQTLVIMKKAQVANLRQSRFNLALFYNERMFVG